MQALLHAAALQESAENVNMIYGTSQKSSGFMEILETNGLFLL